MVNTFGGLAPKTRLAEKILADRVFTQKEITAEQKIGGVN